MALSQILEKMTNIPSGKKSEDEWALHYKGFCPETGERRSEHALNRKNTGKISQLRASHGQFSTNAHIYGQLSNTEVGFRSQTSLLQLIPIADQCVTANDG